MNMQAWFLMFEIVNIPKPLFPNPDIHSHQTPIKDNFFFIESVFRLGNFQITNFNPKGGVPVPCWERGVAVEGGYGVSDI